MPRILFLATRILLAAILVFPAACSRRAERLVGNARLLRGPGANGVQQAASLLPERDTWVESGTRGTGTGLLVGRYGGVEAVALLRVATWTLPGASVPLDSIRSVRLLMPSRGIRIPRLAGPAPPIELELHETGAAWSGDSVTWAGRPPAGPLLGQVTEDFLSDELAIIFPMPVATAYDLVQKWAQKPDSISGFQLSASAASAEGITALVAGGLRFRVLYSATVNDTLKLLTADSPVTTDLFVRTPVPALPAPDDTMLPLGGLHETAVAVRFPNPSLPTGAAVVGATLVFRVDGLADPLRCFPADSTIDVTATLAGRDWSESITSRDSLSASAVVAGAVRLHGVYSAADSLLRIPISPGTLHQWSASPASNLGLVLTAARAEYLPALSLLSRESSRPPTLDIVYTTRPRERF